MSVVAVWEPSPDGEGSCTGDGCCSSLVSPANDARLTQPVTFDWTDASGAASYTIQIDDSSAFSAPILVSQTVTASQLTTGSIPGANVDRWWRVRANGPTGVAGAWSSTRRFRTTTGPVATTATTAPPATTTTTAPPTTTVPAPTTTTTTLPPPPPTTTTVPADTVAVQIAEYDTAKRVLHVEATSTGSTVTLTVTRDGLERRDRHARERRRRPLPGRPRLVSKPAEHYGAEQPRRRGDQGGRGEVAAARRVTRRGVGG